jgi:hypothetical protein
MRENRTYGSEGGATQLNALFLPLSRVVRKGTAETCFLFVLPLSNERVFKEVFYTVKKGESVAVLSAVNR